VRSYQEAVTRYKHLSDWQINFDIDEYPFVPGDTEAGFLSRAVAALKEKHPQASELSVKNYLFLGAPRFVNGPDVRNTHVFERFQRRTPKEGTDLDKPIFIAADIAKSNVHHNMLKKGTSLDVDPAVLRMNHYWGARLQNWGPDTPKILAKTIDDNSAVAMVAKIDRYHRWRKKARAEKS
jgi:hypothetical protein